MRCWVWLAAIFLAGCAALDVPTPTPTREVAPSLAPSPTVLPFISPEAPSDFTGRSEPTSAALAAEGHPTTDPTPVPIATQSSVRLTVFADDNRLLYIDLYGTAGPVTDAVILVHGLEGVDERILTTAEAFQSRRLPVIVFYARGYAPSEGQSDFAQLGGDLSQALQSIAGLGRFSTVGMMAWGESAEAALQTCSAEAFCNRVILVNPLPIRATTALESAAGGAATLPVLLVVDDNQVVAASTAQLLQPLLPRAQRLGYVNFDAATLGTIEAWWRGQ